MVMNWALLTFSPTKENQLKLFVLNNTVTSIGFLRPGAIGLKSTNW
jgi:hypothetical protein